MSKTTNEQLKMAEKYAKSSKLLKWKNPLYLITFDEWMKEALPELTFEQKRKVLIITDELGKKFKDCDCE